MDTILEVDDAETIIGRIIVFHINKIEKELRLLEKDITSIEEDLTTQKDNNDLRIKPLHSSEIARKLNIYRFTLYEEQIVKLKNEITIYQELFDRELIDDIEYELCHAKIIDNPDHEHEEFISPHLSYLYKNIVSAKVNLVRFQKSSLGENDYLKDIDSVKTKIATVQEFTFVDTRIQYPELPHVTIQKFIFNLCDVRKASLSSVPFQPFDKAVIKIIGKLLTGKKRATKEQKNLIQKERRKFQLQERYRYL